MTASPRSTSRSLVEQSSSSSFHSYLDSCTLLIGMGDPILGPTVFQAAAHGAVYVNYAYSSPKKFWMNGRMLVRTQHDEAVRLMEAYRQEERVRTVQWEGPGGVERLTEAVGEELSRAEKKWQKWKEEGGEGQWKEGFIAPVHLLANVSERVRENLFDADICTWLREKG